MRINVHRLVTMPRVNIYLPQEVYRLAAKNRKSINLSAVCAQALREELEASEQYRGISKFIGRLQPRSKIETQLRHDYQLTDALVGEPNDIDDTRDMLGRLAARYLEENLCDGSLLGLAGGRQMWCVVRNLAPRNLKVVVTALGIEQLDPRVLHVHPNTLTTLAWLLYTPRAEAHLIGAHAFREAWANLPVADFPRYFVIASCGPFQEDVPFAELLGEHRVNTLRNTGVIGDFGYIFFDRHGGEHTLPLNHGVGSVLPAETIRDLASRPDGRVIAVAGGMEKRPLVKLVLKNSLCNVLVTDSATAKYLLDEKGR
ncbi:MAG: hypothetical protein HY459_02085 [Parcubacteria group bacterium]|nr:hypothetical protein [Parcubacteria group bacterium]